MTDLIKVKISKSMSRYTIEGAVNMHNILISTAPCPAALLYMINNPN